MSDEGMSHKTKALMVGGALLATTIYSSIQAYLLSKENANLRSQLSQSTSESTEAEDTIEHSKPLNERTYEQAKLLNEYLLLHFGEELSGKFVTSDDASLNQGNEFSLDVPTGGHNYGDFGLFNTTTGEKEYPKFPSYALNFPTRVAQLAAYFAPKGDDKKALDVGCAIGRTAFELTPHFGEVVGLDYSYAFIKAAQELANGDVKEYSVPIEGSVRFNATAKIGDHVRPSVVSFMQGDATALPTDTKYDCITAANLIDRLPCPRAFLTSLANITNTDGVVVLTSPYTWLKEFTPVGEWLVSDDEPSTFENLKKIMEQHFELVHQSHMPFLIRETGRKSQFTFAHATVWKRK